MGKWVHFGGRELPRGIRAGAEKPKLQKTRESYCLACTTHLGLGRLGVDLPF